MSETQEIIAKLKAHFPADIHRERDLPGGGKWFYVPWQAIRERLDEVCPDWQVAYSQPAYLGAFCTVTCTITIGGISRRGVGNAEIELISKSGKDMSRGTPIERAIADAFKSAAEAWGVARYLDEQADPKLKADFIRYMQKRGNGKAAVYHHRNEGNPPTKATPNPSPKPFGQPQTRHQRSTAPQAPAATSGDSSNLDRLRAITSRLGLDSESGDALIKNSLQTLYEGRKTSDLSAAELANVRDRVFINYGRANLPDSFSDADILTAFITLNTSDLSDGAIADFWMKELNRLTDRYLAAIA